VLPSGDDPPSPPAPLRGRTVQPRAVLVHRRTELTELVERHGTHGQAAFFLASRGRKMAEVQERHELVQAAITAVAAMIPAKWRRGMVERAELPRFLFEPGDIIVVVGQDGLVANVAKYLDGQCVVGINAEPARNPGVLVPHPPGAAGALLAEAGQAQPQVDRLTMVSAAADDGQQLMALNEIYIGSASHQTARYTLALPDGAAEAQASSGVIVATGTGATGWCRSAWLERHSAMKLPGPADERLAWFVREAWPSPATGTTATEGDLAAGQELALSAASDELVLFGDGVEADALRLAWGQTVRVGVAARTLNLLR
jgi:NAD kinase